MATTDAITGVPAPPDEPRPRHDERLSPVEWARENLFSTWYNTLLTFLLGVPLAYGLYRTVRFVFFTGRWTAIDQNLTLIMVGRYPRAELWQAWLGLFVVLAFLFLAFGASSRALGGDDETAAPSGGGRFAALRRGWPLLSLIVVLMIVSGAPTSIGLTLAALLVAAAVFQVGKRLPLAFARWNVLIGVVGVLLTVAILLDFGRLPLATLGGLMMTLFLATAAIVLSFPLGVAAALARRSSFPAFRLVSVGYIEFIRGVPLITLLFMGDIGLRFFVPDYLIPPKIIAAVIMLTLFTGAYVAEIVRGGLQSVPHGQSEAGQALGLSPLTITRRLVLPQALRAVIPALVGQFISLFKDTSLVAVISILDLLLVVQTLIPAQPEFLGAGILAELLAFGALIYWAFAYTMSRESQRLERRLGVGER